MLLTIDKLLNWNIDKLYVDHREKIMGWEAWICKAKVSNLFYSTATFRLCGLERAAVSRSLCARTAHASQRGRTFTTYIVKGRREIGRFGVVLWEVDVRPRRYACAARVSWRREWRKHIPVHTILNSVMWKISHLVLFWDVNTYLTLMFFHTNM